LTKLIHNAGIPEGFTGYSIRYLVTMALFRFMKETEVNVFIVHSSNSHTSLNYYHLDKNWVGKMLADMKTQSGIELLQTGDVGR
jgi:hypothetical protein